MVELWPASCHLQNTVGDGRPSDSQLLRLFSYFSLSGVFLELSSPTKELQNNEK